MNDDLTYRAVILCHDPRLCRLLEMELSLCGVSTVAQGEPYGLCLIDLDDHPEAAKDLEGVRYVCWSRSSGAHALAQGAHVICLHRPFALHELEDAVRRLLSGEMICDDRPLAIPWPPVALTSPKRSTEGSEGPRILPLPTGQVSVDGREIALTPRERALFMCLWDNRGAVVSKERLWRALCAAEDIVSAEDAFLAEEVTPVTNTLEVYVCYLRRKIEKPSARRVIITVRGQGYRLDI